MSEVEQRIQDLKISLRSKLEEMPVTLEQQKKIIRNLMVLGVEGDPGWDAICYTYKYMNNQLLLCREDHVSAESALFDVESGNQLKILLAINFFI